MSFSEKILRITTRDERSIIHLSLDYIKLLEKFVGEEGLSAIDITQFQNFQPKNPCIDFLLEICNNPRVPYPKKCLESLSIFFRSIRKDVCPAISIAPKIMWQQILRFISDKNTFDDLVFLLFQKSNNFSLICLLYILQLSKLSFLHVH